VLRPVCAAAAQCRRGEDQRRTAQFPVRHASAGAGMDAAQRPRMGFPARTGAAAAVLALCRGEPARELPPGAVARPRGAGQGRLGRPPMTMRAVDATARSGATGTAVRSLLFVVILTPAWVSVNPFPSLANLKLIEVGDTSDVLNQFAYVAVGGTVALYFLLRDPRALRPLLRPVYFAMLGWLIVSVATSGQPALSARRFIFSILVILLAAAAPLLPTSLRRFSDLTAAVVVAILLLCYAGLAFAPHVSIHQADDVVEPLLAGNWRGLFAHKNIAGAMMVIFVFFGLFVARARSAVLGWS